MDGLTVSLSLSRFPRSQRGFTLIEIAIVLVVIGLLIGGVLTAQSLIDSTKVKRQIQQFQQLDIATQNFIIKFNQIPGDANFGTIGSYYGNGDNDGWLGEGTPVWGPPFYWADNTPCRGAISNECFYFFIDLSRIGGMSGPEYVPTFNGGNTNFDVQFGNGKSFPEAAIGKGGIVVSQNDKQELFWTTVADVPFDIYISSRQPNFTPEQALAIDTKMDDGAPTEGKVVIAEPDATNSRPELYPFSTSLVAEDGWWSGLVTCRTAGLAYDLSGQTNGWFPSELACQLQVKANVER